MRAPHSAHDILRNFAALVALALFALVVIAFADRQASAGREPMTPRYDLERILP